MAATPAILDADKDATPTEEEGPGLQLYRDFVAEDATLTAQEAPDLHQYRDFEAEYRAHMLLRKQDLES